MIGRRTICEPNGGNCGWRSAPCRFLSAGMLLACSVLLAGEQVSGQILTGQGAAGPLVVPLPNDDSATFGPVGETPDRLGPVAQPRLGSPDWTALADPDPGVVWPDHGPQAGAPGGLCPACAGQRSPLLARATGRHCGLGNPLTCESWRFRPFSAGWFLGAWDGGTLIDDWVGGKHGFMAGYRFGWDFDHYWATEMRFSFGNVELCDSHRAKEAQRAADDALGLAEDDPFRNRFERRRDATVGLWDINLVYYPWGDAAWRPYAMAGFGIAGTELIDRLSIRYRETAFAMPIALGVKHRSSNCTAVRLELADNIVFGNRLNGVHYVSLTYGMEIRFGGSRVAYWPWNPGRHYW